MADPTEAFKALRKALLGDVVLSAMLGAADAIYFVAPHVNTPQIPMIDMILRGLNPQKSTTSTGLWRPSFDVKTLAPDYSRCHAIVNHLADNWTIPTERNQPINSDHFSITEISWGQTVPVGSGTLLNSNTPVYLLNTELTLRVVRTS